MGEGRGARSTELMRSGRSDRSQGSRVADGGADVEMRARSTDVAACVGREAAVSLSDLPEILYVQDLAGLLRISRKAVRHRAIRGQLPAPMRLGRTLAWTRDDVLQWLGAQARSPKQRATIIKIALRPYSKDKGRWQVDIRLKDPAYPDGDDIRRRIVAPAGCDEQQARLWGERRAAALQVEQAEQGSGEAEQGSGEAESGLRLPRQRRRAKLVTLREFYRDRFQPEHVELLKHATRDYYQKVWRLYIEPRLGDLPLAAIDDSRVSTYRAWLRRKLAASTANIVLSKVAKMLRFARKLRLVELTPHFERLPEPRKRPKSVLTGEQIAALTVAARCRHTSALVIVLLALDVGLRVSEICALKWQDVDLKMGTVLIQHSVYAGEEQTPKGVIGKIALSSALRSALSELRQEEHRGDLVLYRQSCHTGGKWAQHSQGSIWYLLGQLQRSAGLEKSGPHLLRHTSLTRLANLGASVHMIQAVARHTYLQTTQSYLHTQKTGLSREAAMLLDRAAAVGTGETGETGETGDSGDSGETGDASGSAAEGP